MALSAAGAERVRLLGALALVSASDGAELVPGGDRDAKRRRIESELRHVARHGLLGAEGGLYYRVGDILDLCAAAHPQVQATLAGRAAPGQSRLHRSAALKGG